MAKTLILNGSMIGANADVSFRVGLTPSSSWSPAADWSSRATSFTPCRGSRRISGRPRLELWRQRSWPSQENRNNMIRCGEISPFELLFYSLSNFFRLITVRCVLRPSFGKILFYGQVSYLALEQNTLRTLAIFLPKHLVALYHLYFFSLEYRIITSKIEVICPLLEIPIHQYRWSHSSKSYQGSLEWLSGAKKP